MGLDPTSCSGDDCVGLLAESALPCRAGERTCSSIYSNVPLLCSPAGVWEAQNPCAAPTPSCLMGECVAAGTTCSASTPCVNGSCLGLCTECVPGSRGCSSNTPRTCSAQGTWVDGESCSSIGATCQPETGMCVADEWTVQFGSDGVARNDSARAVATDASGGIFVAGEVEGALPFSDSGGLGNGDGYIRKYDAGGNLLWSIQLGTPAPDRLLALAVGPNGDPVVMGHTDGDFTSFGTPRTGTSTYLARYSGMTGAELRRDQWSGLATHMTVDVNDAVVQVDIDADGRTNVVKNDSDGATLFQFAIERQVADLATDGDGNILITGGEGDAYVAKYNIRGVFVWQRLLGDGAADNNYPSAVCADEAGNVLVVGRTASFPPRAFLTKFSADGLVLWSVSKIAAEGVAVAADAVGNVFAVATLTASDAPNLPSGDFWLLEYTAGGVELSSRIIGSSGTEWVESVAVDPGGVPYVVGSTDGVLTGTASPGGDYDAFLLKLQ